MCAAPSIMNKEEPQARQRLGAASVFCGLLLVGMGADAGPGAGGPTVEARRIESPVTWTR